MILYGDGKMLRKYLIISIISCVFMVLVGCQQKTIKAEGLAAAAETKTGPKIEFENLVYDFGKVGPRKKLNGEFKFTNIGNAPLKITKVEKCCGAVIELDKDELNPDESGVLHVQYTSGISAGKITKKLYVNSNDKANPRTMLTIQAETVLRVDYEPKRVKLRLNDENAGCPGITLTSIDNKPFSIASFDATGGSLSAEFNSSIKAKEFVLKPKVDVEKLRKRTSGLINIGLAFSEPDAEPETVTIIFQALSRFTLRPSMLFVYYDKSEEPIQKTLFIINNYGEDFDVESTTSKEGIIKVLKQDKVGDRYRLELQITPHSDQDDKRFYDTFTINLKGGEKLEVPCRGIYRAPKTQAGR
jgi:hypothetical protein